MEFLHLYLLFAAAIFCVAGIAVTAVIDRGRNEALPTGRDTYVEKYLKKTAHDLERSRIGLSLQEYFMLKVGCPAGLTAAAYFLSSDRTLMLACIPLGFMLPNMVMLIRKGDENRKFETRFVRALSQMASSLHSGMTVEQAIDSVVDSELLHPNIRDDFRLLSSKMKLGMPLTQAFNEFAEMTESKDAADVATAITIMTDVGGDAGVAIEKIQKNIEDRLLYRRKRESMMTESKLIAIASDVMPILVLVGMYIFMPETMTSIFEDGMLTIGFFVVIGLIIIGSVVVHKMLNDKIDAS